MRTLDPVLYEHFIGQHLTEKERLAPFEKEDNLVERILGNMDRSEAYETVEKQKEIDNEQFEEEEEDSDDDDEKMEVEEDDIEATMTFREEQREELVRLLEERFLSGKDTQFDYETVDNNEVHKFCELTITDDTDELCRRTTMSTNRNEIFKIDTLTTRYPSRLQQNHPSTRENSITERKKKERKSVVNVFCFIYR